MAVQVKDIINGSLRLLGVIATGEAPSASEQSDALFCLNDLIEDWSNDGYMIFSESREEFSLSTAKQKYTIGDGGDFDTKRPSFIRRAAVIEIPGGTEILIRVLTQGEWARIHLKDTSSNLPQAIYYNAEFPLGTIEVWPKPDKASTLALYSKKPITGFESADDEMSLPPGYKKALRYNLALELAPEYGKKVNEVVAGVARESKARIQRVNTRPVYMASDAADLNRRKVFNWITGE